MILSLIIISFRSSTSLSKELSASLTTYIISMSAPTEMNIKYEIYTHYCDYVSITVHYSYSYLKVSLIIVYLHINKTCNNRVNTDDIFTVTDILQQYSSFKYTLINFRFY